MSYLVFRSSAVDDSITVYVDHVITGASMTLTHVERGQHSCVDVSVDAGTRISVIVNWGDCTIQV